MLSICVFRLNNMTQYLLDPSGILSESHNVLGSLF